MDCSSIVKPLKVNITLFYLRIDNDINFFPHFNNLTILINFHCTNVLEFILDDHLDEVGNV